MSELLVRVVTIDGIKEHPNADKLEIANAGGWDIVTGKGNYVVGDVAVHVPPDAMIPRPLAEEWGVDKYLVWKKNAEKGRVKAARLRSYVSFGFLAPNDSNAEVGTDLREHYGIEKYEPPPPPVGMSAGQMRSEHPLFTRYTDIQNLRNYPDKLDYSEPLIVTEKIHGTNSRLGWVRPKDGSEGYEFVIGTHRTQRDPDECGVYGTGAELYLEQLSRCFEWLHQVTTDRGEDVESVIFFGEIYGAGVQDLHYGEKGEVKGYRLFDICMNGQYLNGMAFFQICEEFGLPTVPIVSRGVFTFEDLCEMAEGDTTLDDEHIREGIVVRPMCGERFWGRGTKDPNQRRMIFKIISGSYLTRKGGTEHH